MASNTSITYTCDICNNITANKDSNYYFCTGYHPIESHGIMVTFTTYGIPTDKPLICEECMKKAITDMYQKLVIDQD